MNKLASIAVAVCAAMSMTACVTGNGHVQRIADIDIWPESPPLSARELRMVETLGAEVADNNDIIFGGIRLNRASGTLSFPAKINMWGGELEVLVSTPRGRNHEALVFSEIDPFHLQVMLILSGAVNRPRVGSENLDRAGTLFSIEVRPEHGGREPIENWAVLFDNVRPFPETNWMFVGSNFSSDGICRATYEGNIVDINSLDESTILQPPLDDFYLLRWFRINSDRIEEVGNHYNEVTGLDEAFIPVTIYLRRRDEPAPTPIMPELPGGGAEEAAEEPELPGLGGE